MSTENTHISTCRKCGCQFEMTIEQASKIESPVFCYRCSSYSQRRPSYKRVIEALMDMVASFAYDVVIDSVMYYHDGGHGDIEAAFAVLQEVGVLVRKPGDKEYYSLDYKKLEELDGV